MKISANHLRTYADLPADDQLRDLLDDCGVEVKRWEDTDKGPILTLELLANRGDHHCYAGVARELTGRVGGSVRLPEIATLEVGPSPIRVFIETPGCLVYTATLLTAHGPGASLDPKELFALEAAGIHSVSAPVDATNLANLELGQPTHAFDADTIDGGITIRPSRQGEKAWALFTAEPVELPVGTMVIADDSKILAVAGVIGCEESKTTENTRRVLVESATFDPVMVRKAARALGVHTDSSARFERGSDPSAPLAGAGRVVALLEKAGYRRNGTTGRFGDWKDPMRALHLDLKLASAFLDHPITEEDAADRLHRYGFLVLRPGDGILDVTVPPWRLWDIETTGDLYEELAKSIGYNNTPIGLPPIDRGALVSAAEVRKETVEEVLVGLGFYEVFTDAFYARDVRDRLGIGPEHPLFAHVETMNAVDRGYSLLRNNAVAPALETVATNLRLQRREIRAYEWTRTFHPKPDAENGVCIEHKVLWLVCNGPVRTPTWQPDPPDADVHYAAGIVAEIGNALGIELALDPSDPKMPLAGLLHPNRQAFIVAPRPSGRAIVGIVGELHPRVLAAYKIKRERPIYVEISANALLGSASNAVSYTPPPDAQPIDRDLAFTLTNRVTAGDVIDAIRDGAPPELVSVTPTDLFVHDVGGKPARTLTFTLVFSQDKRGFTAEQINATVEAVAARVVERLGERGVARRA